MSDAWLTKSVEKVASLRKSGCWPVRCHEHALNLLQHVMVHRHDCTAVLALSAPYVPQAMIMHAQLSLILLPERHCHFE